MEALQILGGVILWILAIVALFATFLVWAMPPCWKKGTLRALPVLMLAIALAWGGAECMTKKNFPSGNLLVGK